MRLTLFLLLAFSISLFSCTNRKTSASQKLLKDIPDEFIIQLTTSDDSTFAKYAREIGLERFAFYSSKIRTNALDRSLNDYRNLHDTYFAYLKRIVKTLDVVFNFEFAFKDYAQLKTYTPDRAYKLYTLRFESWNIYRNRNLTRAEKLNKYFELLDTFEELGDQPGRGICKLQLFLLYADMGKESEHINYLKEAITELTEIGYHTASCQALGVLGSIYEKNGEIDSMIICYEEAERIANLTRNPVQAARISSFYAGYYARRGRLSLAHNLMYEALERCREYKGGAATIRYIADAMHFYAEISCWDLVDRLSEYAKLLAHHHPLENPGDPSLIRITINDARRKMSLGYPDEADSIFHSIRKEVDDIPNRLDYTRMLFFWAEGLIEAGRPERAIDIIHEGLARSKSNYLPKYTARCELLLAKAEYLLGHYRESDSALDQFDILAQDYTATLTREWIERDALRGKIQLREGNTPAAIQHLEEGLTRLIQTAGKMDASVHSYLWVGECYELRDLMHEVTALTPALGYGGELYWRDIYRILGGEARTNGHESAVVSSSSHIETIDEKKSLLSIMEHLHSLTDTMRRRIRELDVIHCMYLVHDNEIWRWTVTPTELRREVLDCPASYLRDLVHETVEMMIKNQTSESTSTTGKITDNLQICARLLLPNELLNKSDDHSKSLLLITTDEFLGQLPFETLNIGEGDSYSPLLLHYDVAYLRHADRCDDSDHEAPGVILVNNDPPQELKRRYPFLQRLHEVLKEGRAVAALDSNAVFFTGEASTKANLFSVWEDASYIYLATHTLRDPEIPYMLLIPLAVSEGQRGFDASYLDITDIRSADLCACDIAILSGCSSGVPYITTRSAGPSLGDAFLDAGVGAVVQTFWDVRDDEARELMTAFVRMWNDPGASKIHSLCEARRRFLSKTTNNRQSFSWASYAIKIRGM